MPEPWAIAVFLLLAEASIRATLVAAAVAIVLWVTRAESSRVRHAAWAGVLAAMLAMPVLPSLVPASPVEWPAAHRSIERVKVSTWRSQPGSPSAIPTGVATPVVPVADSARATSDARPRDATASAPNRVSLALLVALIYVVGFAIMVARLITGWVTATRVLKRAQRLPGEYDVYESAELTTPACIGVLRPRIVLPSSWRSWSRETLEGVMLHERAHLARRDSLVAFLAQVNCCVFWFHPLAWWLRHTLATLAEFACDTAALNGSNDRARYANVLIEMARTSQRHRGRLALVGVSAEGRSQLARRIARVLEAVAERAVSKLAQARDRHHEPRHRVLGVAACRPEPAPLRENPEFVAREAETRAARELVASVKQMSAAEIAALEAAWKANPEDLETLRKILIYYGPDFSGKDTRDQAAVIRARRPYILWLIEHHPDYDPRRMGWNARHLPYQSRSADRSRGLRSGEAVVDQRTPRGPSVNARTLGNAAWFLETHDRPLAEQMLLRGATDLACRRVVDRAWRSLCHRAARLKRGDELQRDQVGQRD